MSDNYFTDDEFVTYLQDNIVRNVTSADAIQELMDMFDLDDDDVETFLMEELGGDV